MVFTSCPDGTGARLVEQYGATVPEVPEVYLTCNDPEPARERVTVEGSLRQAGSVALFSDSTQGVANDGSFAEGNEMYTTGSGASGFSSASATARSWSSWG